jgi:hypothetical protein
VIVTALAGIMLGATVFAGVIRADTSSSPSVASPGLIASRGSLAPVIHGHGLRVLFIGNSFTFGHDLADLTARFASDTPGYEPMLTYTWAIGGASLAQDQAASGFTELLHATHWDVVVLQEQTALSSFAVGFPTVMDEDVARLAGEVRAAGAAPMLFETWGDQTASNLYAYPFEQRVITSNYDAVGRAQNIPVAHVGLAWELALQQRPTLALWGPDGHHPALSGSYLAAAVISSCANHVLRPAATIPDPQLSTYTAGLDSALALWLRQTALESLGQSGCSA